MHLNSFKTYLQRKCYNNILLSVISQNLTLLIILNYYDFSNHQQMNQAQKFCTQ